MPAKGVRELSQPVSRPVVVVAGGDPVDPSVAALLPADAVVIAADGGLAAAQKLCLRTDLLVGDLDSVDAGALEDAAFAVERHPRDKDRTDLVLALDAAIARDATHVTVVSGGGGRLDHAMGNLLVLAAPAYAGVTVDAFVGAGHVSVVHGTRALDGPKGEIVSLFAVGGPASGVTTSGLRFALDDDVLQPLSSRGISNEFAGGPASITVTDGVLLVIRPHPGEK